MRTVKTQKGYNPFPTDGIQDPIVIGFLQKLQIHLGQFQQKAHDDINALQQIEVVPVASLPTASAALQGKTFVVNNGVGNADTHKICVKLADGSFSWKTISLT